VPKAKRLPVVGQHPAPSDLALGRPIHAILREFMRISGTKRPQTDRAPAAVIGERLLSSWWRRPTPSRTGAPSWILYIA